MSLTKDWNHEGHIIEEAKDLSILSLDELVGSLMAYESLQWSQIEEENPKTFAFCSHPKEEDSSQKEGNKQRN